MVRRRLLAPIWLAACRLVVWAWRELAPAAACFLAIYVGVCLSMLLPISMVSWLALPASLPAVGAALEAFPKANIPEWDALASLLGAAIPISVRVFANGGYGEWRGSDDRLGVRLLYACHAGVVWPRAWWRRTRVSHMPPTSGRG